MMNTGVLLIHGFGGDPSDLCPLHRDLVDHFGAEAVMLRPLPDHGGAKLFTFFDRDRLLAAVTSDIVRARQRYDKLAVVGHSTGGSLALLAMEEAGIRADLLVLAATPHGFDAGARERWEKHRQGKEPLNLTAVAGLVTAIVAAGRLKPSVAANGVTLLVHGERDRLVPFAESRFWQRELPPAAGRMVLVPEADHQLFRTGKATVGIGAIRRAISELVQAPSQDAEILGRLQTIEPEAAAFLAANPAAGFHLSRCPGSIRMGGSSPELPPIPDHEPVFANIEITTRCNLACQHCARRSRPRTAEDMPPERFERLLDLLPHAYRITLVGLGEPLLHPDLPSLIGLAKAKGRRVAVATNSMALTADLSGRLLAAGLDSIAFSLDAVDPALAAGVRPGSDMALILRNIENFTTQARALPRPVSLAVFTAVSTVTLPHLPKLVERVKRLGVHVLMLSDLNFRENSARSLRRNKNGEAMQQLRRAVGCAFSLGLPVLSVRGLEEFGLAERYGDFLLLPPDQLAERSPRHRWCLSPWQTVPVDVAGNVTVCDCRPDEAAGNLLTQPLEEIWNGEVMVRQRARMRSGDPPADCLLCPRF